MPAQLRPLFFVTFALLVGHAPLVALHLRGLWQKEQYQYFPFVIGAVVWLLVSRWNEAVPQDTIRFKQLPTLLLAGSALLLVVSTLTVSPWLAMVSLNIALAAVFAWLGQQRKIPYLWGIWLLLWLMVPIPLGFDNRLIVFLQGLSSHASSLLLDSVGIRHLMGGNVLTLVDKQLFVDEACSGIISVMSIAACAMIYSVWNDRSFMHLVLLTLAGIFWAVILNVTRIAIIAAAQYHYEFDLSTGTSHEILGLALFSVMFLALVSTDYLLVPMMAPIDLKHADEHWQWNLLVRAWNRVQGEPVKTFEETPAERAAAVKRATEQTEPEADDSLHDTLLPEVAPLQWGGRLLAMGIPFLLLGIVQLLWLPSTDTTEASEAVERALTLQESFVPSKIGSWELESFESIEREALNDFGRYSRTYNFQHSENTNLRAVVSLDFPYIGGWHDLCVCYRNSGWTIHERLVQAEGSASEEDAWQHIEGDLEDPSGAKAIVLFAGFDVQGLPARPPSALVLHRSWFRLRRRLLYNLAPQLFQVQVFSPGSQASDDQARESLRELLYQTRELFRDHVANGGPTVGAK